MESSKHLQTQIEEKLLVWKKSIDFTNLLLKKSENIATIEKKYKFRDDTHTRDCDVDSSESQFGKDTCVMWGDSEASLFQDENKILKTDVLSDSESKNVHQHNNNAMKDNGNSMIKKLPVLGYADITCVHDEASFFTNLYMNNLLGVIKSKSKMKFFSFKVTMAELVNSINENGLFEIKTVLHNHIKNNSNFVRFLILLNENKNQLPTLLGVAKINNTKYFDENKSFINVEYITLSTSSLEINRCNINHVPSVLEVLRRYLDEIKHDTSKVILPNQLLSSKKTKLCLKEIQHQKHSKQQREYIRQHETIMSCLKNISTDTNCWFEWEYKNLEGIDDWKNSSFIICDMIADDIKQCVTENGKLYVDDVIKIIINQEMITNQNIYLIFRKHSFSQDDSKLIFGIARVVGVFIENIRVEFLCLSRAQYVSHPWCDEEFFTNGQIFNVKEDVRILLEEYKMSLKMKRAKPIFADVYPWSGKYPSTLPRETSIDKDAVSNFARTKIDTKSDAVAKSHDFLSQKKPTSLDKEKNSSIHGKVWIPDNSPTKSQDPPNSSNNSQQRSYSPNKLQQRPHSPNKSHQIPNSPTKTHQIPNSPTKTQQKPNSPNKLQQSQSLSPGAHSKRRAAMVAVNMLNLRVSAKLLSRDSWFELELKNLERLKVDCNARNEFYIAQTNIAEIKKSVKNGKLNVSEKNVENLGGSSRNKKYIFLKAKIDTATNANFPVVGIAAIDRVNDIEVNENGNGYLITVIYYSLSVPLINMELSGREYTDAVEVRCDVAQRFTNQYIVALKQGNVNVLLDYIYPWCPKPPSSAKFIDAVSPPKNVAQPSNLTPICDEMADDNLGKHLQSSNDAPKFTFKDIRRDLTQETNHCETFTFANDQPNNLTMIRTSTKSFFQLKTKLNEEIRDEAAINTSLISSNKNRSFTNNQLRHSSNTTPKRGGGRGKILMVQAASFGRETSWR